MTTATLAKWGTGQGIHVSKQVMRDAQISVGDVCAVESKPGVIVLRFNRSEHRPVRCEPVSFDDLFSSWSGSREDVIDPWVGSEPHGAERGLWE